MNYRDIPYKPAFPADYCPGVGIIGCGQIVRSMHLPAYQKYGVRVVGVYDPQPEATADVARYGVQQVYPTLDALLTDPAVGVVDIATGPSVRAELITRALDAGKHVLSQKPLARSVAEARHLIAYAAARGLLLAVNQNGRWSPPWRVATELVARGAIGTVRAVTHLFETSFVWVPDSHFDAVPHWLIYDYAIHWVDITRCWMDEQQPIAVRAREHRSPEQPPQSQATWGARIEIEYADGARALIWSPGYAATSTPGHPFWIHGNSGTIRGNTLNTDALVLEHGPQTTDHRPQTTDDGRWTMSDEPQRTGEPCVRPTNHRPQSGNDEPRITDHRPPTTDHRPQSTGDVQQTFIFDTQWFPDGFAGTLGELLCAIAEKREPSNSARHNLLSLQLTLAACESAERDGEAVSV